MDLKNILRALALGDSICHVLKVLRLWGAQNLTARVYWAGPLKKDFTCVGRSKLGPYEDLMCVLRTLAPGGSICNVLRGSEALGGSNSNQHKQKGGSARVGSHARGRI